MKAVQPREIVSDGYSWPILRFVSEHVWHVVHLDLHGRMENKVDMEIKQPRNSSIGMLTDLK